VEINTAAEMSRIFGMTLRLPTVSTIAMIIASLWPSLTY
jgi:hypothetical protein